MSDAGGLPRSLTERRHVESFWSLDRDGTDGQHPDRSGESRLGRGLSAQCDPTAAGPVRPMWGAQIRKKIRRDALTPRSSVDRPPGLRQYRASRGKWSTIRPLPRTMISAVRQRISSSSSETIFARTQTEAGEEKQNRIIAASTGRRSIWRRQHACDLFRREKSRRSGLAVFADPGNRSGEVARDLADRKRNRKNERSAVQRAGRTRADRLPV